MTTAINASMPDFDRRTESQVRAMLHVVPDQVRRGDFVTARRWKETTKDAAKALDMQPGPRRTAAIGRIHIALSAMGGGNP